MMEFVVSDFTLALFKASTKSGWLIRQLKQLARDPLLVLFVAAIYFYPT